MDIKHKAELSRNALIEAYANLLTNALKENEELKQKLKLRKVEIEALKEQINRLSDGTVLISKEKVVKILHDNTLTEENENYEMGIDLENSGDRDYFPDFIYIKPEVIEIIEKL